MSSTFSDPAISSVINTSLSLLFKIKPEHDCDFIQLSKAELQCILEQDEESCPDAGRIVDVDNWGVSPSPLEVCLYMGPVGSFDGDVENVYAQLSEDMVTDILDYFDIKPPVINAVQQPRNSATI